MSDPYTGQPAGTYPTPKKSFPILAVVLGGVALLIAVAVIGGIKAFHSVQAGSSEAIAVGNRFVDSMGQHNYQAARALFTSQIQATTPAGNLKDIETLVEKHHGSYVAHGQPQWNIQNWNGQTSVSLVYPAQFTKSTSSISMTLVQTGTGYQVYATHYEF